MNRRLVVGLVLLAGCSSRRDSRRAESVPVEPLPMAQDTVVIPWTNLPEAAWLGGRRWVVVGPEHDAAMFVDFEAKKAEPVGGLKNPELVKPYAVFAIGDTAAIADWARSRVSFWGPDGKLAGTVPAPATTRGVLPRMRDAAGHYYFEVPPIAGPDGAGLKDSAAVVRSDPGLAKFDTVARLAPLDVAEVTETRGKRYERLVFSGNDWWGVRPDGQIWIARIRRNEVSVLQGGKEVRGERLPDPVLEVTRQDKERYVNSFPDDLKSMAQKLQFAPFKPAFERGFGGADGLVWLRKSKRLVDSVRRYQVVDTAGTLARVFSTTGEGQIVAAGREAVLFAEQFKGGLRIMELRLPKTPPPPATKP